MHRSASLTPPIITTAAALQPRPAATGATRCSGWEPSAAPRLRISRAEMNTLSAIHRQVKRPAVFRVPVNNTGKRSFFVLL